MAKPLSKQAKLIEEQIERMIENNKDDANRGNKRHYEAKNEALYEVLGYIEALTYQKVTQ